MNISGQFLEILFLLLIKIGMPKEGLLPKEV